MMNIRAIRDSIGTGGKLGSLLRLRAVVTPKYMTSLQRSAGDVTERSTETANRGMQEGKSICTHLAPHSDWSLKIGYGVGHSGTQAVASL